MTAKWANLWQTVLSGVILAAVVGVGGAISHTSEQVAVIDNKVISLQRTSDNTSDKVDAVRESVTRLQERQDEAARRVSALEQAGWAKR